MGMVKFDGACRVAFPKELQRRLFSTILQNQKITLKELARILDVSRWTLKRWRLGTYSVPSWSFAKLYSLFPETWVFVKKHHPEIKSPSWGARKGGTTMAHKLGPKKLAQRMEHVRSFIRKEYRSRSLVKPPDLNTPDFWEFFGAMLGDGCLSKYHVNGRKGARYCMSITGNSKFDREYFEYLKLLVEKLFGLNPYIMKEKRANVLRFVIQSRAAFEVLELVGYPVGRKTDLRLPARVLSLPWERKKVVIRGLLDTDGCVFARKDEKYRYPYVMITSAYDKLRTQLVKILRDRGYPAYIHGDDVLVRGAANLRRWMSDIGSSHPKIIKRYKEWIETGRMLPLGGPVAQRQIGHSGAQAESTAFAC